MNNYGICPKCKRKRRMTRHHVLPRRFFGATYVCIKLCRECHDKLERLIPYQTQLPEVKYYEILFDFIFKD